MATPEFIKDLRRDIGHKELFLPSVRANVIRRHDEDGTALPVPEVLLVRRSDNGAWMVTSGILEPGEEPAAGAVREVEEETGVVVRPVRVAGVAATRLVEYPNGDRARYVDTVFEMKWVSGTPRVNDDESTEAGWFPVSSLPEPLSPGHRETLEWALDAGADARWRG